MWIKETQSELQNSIHKHMWLLGHKDYGVTELRIFKPRPLVAYADNEKDVTHLLSQMDRQIQEIYVGVQPRPLDQFDEAPNCWKAARSAPKSNCACDRDIEFITACFFDIDVISEERTKGHPASDEELQRSYYTAQLLSRENGLALSSTICCSGNGHYVIAPIVPIQVDSDDVSAKFKQLCHQLAEKIAHQVGGIKIDHVYNLSRVMRLMGTVNRKAKITQGRPHRIAHFVTEPILAKSMALHHMILNTEITVPVKETNTPSGKIKCDPSKIEKCEFIKWCRQRPIIVTEPQWFAMITNLARLEGGEELIHEISRLDEHRYDHQQTQRLIERILRTGYDAVRCENINKLGFQCQKLGNC